MPYYIVLTLFRSQNRAPHNGRVLVFREILTGISNLEALGIEIPSQLATSSRGSGNRELRRTYKPVPPSRTAQHPS